MAIYELEARFKLGPIEIGKKPGKQLGIGDSRTITDYDWGFLFKGHEWNGSGAIVKNDDSVKLVHAVDDDHTYGYTQCDGALLKGEEINKDPEVSKKIRYVPTPATSSQG